MLNFEKPATTLSCRLWIRESCVDRMTGSMNKTESGVSYSECHLPKLRPSGQTKLFLPQPNQMHGLRQSDPRDFDFGCCHCTTCRCRSHRVTVRDLGHVVTVAFFSGISSNRLVFPMADFPILHSVCSREKSRLRRRYRGRVRRRPMGSQILRKPF